ncbi:MAG: hypothetical protein ACRC8S_19615 [Fimbriiglobus sp.]
MGRLRGFLIRFVILALVAVFAGGAWVAHQYVRPEKVREALIATLQEKMPGVEVQVDAASLRIFGGISVQGLALTRPGESEPFFQTLDANISHDKESLTRGVVQIRKIEIDGATIRLIREPDGVWNLEKLGVSKGSAEMPAIPTILVKNATVHVRDLRADPLPPLALTDVKLNLMNDPVATINVKASFVATPKPPQGECKLRVPMQISAEYNRVDRGVKAHLEVPELTLTPDLAPGFAKVDPMLGEYMSQFTATLGIRADVKLESQKPPKIDVKVDVKEGRFDDENLPWPLEQIAGIVQYREGKVSIEKGSAKFGRAHVELALETRPLTPPTTPRLSDPPTTLPTKIAPTDPDDTFKKLEDKLEKLNVTIRELPIEDELFAKLPKKAHRMRQMFNPTGTIDIGVTMARNPAGLKQEFEVRPNRAAMNYEKFKYPVKDLSGYVRKITLDDGKEEFKVLITGMASDRKIELSGSVGSEGPDPRIDLRLTGNDFPIDEKLFAAMPAKYTNSLNKLHATGRGDFSVAIRQAQDINRCESTISVTVYDASLHYEHFPYPLRDIRGKVNVRIAAVSPERPERPGTPMGPIVDTDRVEIRSFQARHAEGQLWLEGDHEPIVGTQDRKLTLRIQGLDLPFDQDFQNAASAMKIGNLWQTFSPKGKVTFGADLEIMERGTPMPSATVVLSNNPSRVIIPANATATTLPGEPPFNAAHDLKLIVNFKGPTITPDFFAYELENLAGVLSYKGGKLYLDSFSARHGTTKMQFEAAQILFGEAREVYANVGGLLISPVPTDADFLRALPPKAAKAFRELKIRGHADLLVHQLVVNSPAAPPESPNRTLARSQAPMTAAQPSASTRGDPTVFWETTLKLHGASMDAGLDWTNLHGSIFSKGRYNGDHLDVVKGHAWFDRATVYQQPMTNLKMSYLIRPQKPLAEQPGKFSTPVIEFPDLTANVFQGTLGGEAWVSLSEVPQFRLWITAAGVKLDELASHNKLATNGELRGLAQGKILLENPVEARSGQTLLTGVGQIDVPNGRMYNLPVLLPMLKLLKLQTPDQTAFEEAHASFQIRGDRVYVNQLDLVGTAVSLGGSGEMDMKAEDVRFEFFTIWSQALKRWLSTPFGDVTSFVSGNLFKIELTKAPGYTMQYRPQMLPVVTEPMRAVLERFRGRAGLPNSESLQRASTPR